MGIKIDKANNITKIEASQDWITKYQTEKKVLPSLPRHLLPVVNKYVKGSPISKDIEVIAVSPQHWQKLTSNQKAELLELVEWNGGNADDYLGYMQSMLPKDPDFSKRMK